MSNDNNQYNVHTVNLSRAWITPRHKRTDRVINLLKEFAKRHTKSEIIKIDQALNRQIWENGKRNPPRRIRIKMTKEDNEVIISYYEEEKPSLRTENEIDVKK